MRNPVYTVRSHRVHTSNCPSVASQICHQHTHTRWYTPQYCTFRWPHSEIKGFFVLSIVPLLCIQLERWKCLACFSSYYFFVCLVSPQHQGRLSLDLSQQKRTNDYSESSSSRSSRASHGTNSLPSSARLGQSDTQARTHTHKDHWLSVPFPLFGMLRRSINSSVISSPHQVLPIMSSTARKGSKSLPLPAILAPCWGQTEVRLLLITRLLKYSAALRSNCVTAVRCLAMFLKVSPDPHACYYLSRLAVRVLRSHSASWGKNNLRFCPLSGACLIILIRLFEPLRLFTFRLPPGSYENIIFSAKVVNIYI